MDYVHRPRKGILRTVLDIVMILAVVKCQSKFVMRSLCVCYISVILFVM